MPYVTPKTVIFGVRIPPSREGDSQIADLRRSFHLLLAIGSVPVFLVTVYLPSHYGLSSITLSGTFVELLYAYLVYYRTNRKLERIKTDQGWYENLKEATGAFYSQDQLRSRGYESLLTMLPSIVIIAITIYIGAVTYPSLPNPFPTHFGLNGQPNGYSQKSIGTAFLVVFIQIGITAMIFAIGYAISRSRQEIDVSRPIETTIQQDRFKHYTRTSLYLFQALINVTLMFSSLSIWGLMDPGYTLPLTVVPILAGSAILVLVLMNMGQMGSRLSVPVKEAPTGKVNRNDDQFWKAGAIYYNKEDSAVLVGKRFGVGWTFNFARPVTWVIMGSIAVGTILSVLLPILIATHHI